MIMLWLIYIEPSYLQILHITISMSLSWRIGSAPDPAIAESIYWLIDVCWFFFLMVETIVWSRFLLGWNPNYGGFLKIAHSFQEMSKQCFSTLPSSKLDTFQLELFKFWPMVTGPFLTAKGHFGEIFFWANEPMGKKCCAALEQFDLRPETVGSMLGSIGYQYGYHRVGNTVAPLWIYQHYWDTLVAIGCFKSADWFLDTSSMF